jgi:hypothetical protein
MTREIPLSRGLFALVDDEDFARAVSVGSWNAKARGRNLFYAQRKFGRAHVHLHTFLTGWPLVDHRNGDGLDNRRANLREATHTQNTWNARRRSDNTSGFKGVSQRRSDGKWVAYIGIDRRQVYLGSYVTVEEAARSYDAAAREHRGEFALLNFPEGITA